MATIDDLRKALDAAGYTARDVADLDPSFKIGGYPGKTKVDPSITKDATDTTGATETPTSETPQEDAEEKALRDKLNGLAAGKDPLIANYAKSLLSKLDEYKKTKSIKDIIASVDSKLERINALKAQVKPEDQDRFDKLSKIIAGLKPEEMATLRKQYGVTEEPAKSQEQPKAETKPDAIANHQIGRLQQVISSKQPPDQKKAQIKEILHALMDQRMDLLRSDTGKPYMDKIVQVLAKGKLFGMNRDGYIDQVTDRVKRLVPLRESHARVISKILKSVGLTWTDIGYTQVLSESITGVVLFEKIDNIVDVESIILESMKPILKKFR